MVKLTVKSEYACLALVDLAENYKKGIYVKIESISKRKNIPKKFLEHILFILKRAGYAISRRGADGGYKLAKPPTNISVAEVIRLIDGPLAPVVSVSKYFYEPSPIEQHKKLTELMRELRDFIADRLEKTTFQHLIE